MLRRQAPVARFVAAILLILALVLFGALGTIEQLSERARMHAELVTRAQVMADQLAASLALPVWNFDQPQLDKIAQSVLHDREAAGVIVKMNDVSADGLRVLGLLRADQGVARPVTADQPPPVAGAVLEERPIIAAGERIGSVKVFYTPRYMEQSLRDHQMYQAATFVAFGGILTAVLYVLLWRTVLRPLGIIEQYAGQVSTGESVPLAGGGRFRGELERLRASIEKMVELLAARYAALQQNQRMLSLVLDSAPQSIFWKDVNGRYLGCNEPFARHAGLARPNSIVGKTDFDLPWPHSAAELYRANDLEVMTSGIAKNHIIEPLHSASGAEITVETTKVPLVDAEGKVYGVLGVFEDITARLANERVIADQLHFEELVASISSELVVAQPDNLQPILDRALGDIARLLDADRVILGCIDDASGDLISRASFCPGGPPVPDRLVMPRAYPELWQDLLRGQTIFVPSLAGLGPQSLDRARFEELGIQSQIAAPVLVDGRLQYVLAAATIGRRAIWSETAVARIRGLAGLLATTVLRCESEEAVRASERQFRTFIEQAPVPIFLVPSPDGEPLYFNPAFTRAFGYTRQDIGHPEEWWPAIYPDPAYRKIRRAAWERIVANATERGTFQDAEEAEMTTKSGAVRYAEVRVTIVAGYRMSFLNDLTARREAETALRLTQYAVDHNPVKIFRIGMDGSFHYANQAAFARFGYSPAELLTMHIWDIAYTVTAKEWPARAVRLREQGSTLLESRYVTKSGAVFPVEVRVQYVDFSGKQYFFVFADDITDRKAAQEAEHAYTRRIAKLATELTRAEERQRRELAATLHDGVGQTLFAATTQLLAVRGRVNGVPPVEVETAITLLDQVTRETRELTFELCPPVLYQLGLMPALQRLADQFTARYGVACALTGRTTGPADLNLRGLAYQGVRELLNNTAKYAQAKQVAISAAEGDGYVHVEVADDGRGFDPASLKPGTGGFGLFHLRERIGLLGGSLSIDSAPGQGCRVQFKLPMNVTQLTE